MLPRPGVWRITAPTEAAPTAAAATSAELGKPAPDFTLAALDGSEHSLAAHKGKIVVLEWFNPGCPFVKFAWGEGPFKGKGTWGTDVVWLTINSSAPGKQGNGADANKAVASEWGIQHPVLLDESGTVGKTYGAKTTPHMYVIDKAGMLVYAGAIDDRPTSRKSDVQGANNYVRAALQSVAAGEPVKTPVTRAYGCTVKYA